MTEQYLPKQDTRPTQIIYALYLAGLVTANVTLLIGVIIFIGTLLWPLLVVWLGVRCIIGWVAVRKGQPPARPGSWLW